MEPTKYVLGFMYLGEKVILVKKFRPVWQQGNLNGVGGKIEPGESAIQAMTREFKEETGYETMTEEWEEFAVMEGPEFHVTCFRAIPEDYLHGAIMSALGTGCETIVVIDCNQIADHKCLRTLLYLVPFGKLYTVGTLPIPRFNELPRIHESPVMEVFPARQGFNEFTHAVLRSINNGRQPEPEEMLLALQDIRDHYDAETAITVTEEQHDAVLVENAQLYKELAMAGIQYPRRDPALSAKEIV